jgi:N-methylhydantoinase A
MIEEALEEFNALNVTKDQLTIEQSMDTRYLGQFHEIELPLPEEEITAQSLEKLKQEFHKKHNELFTFSLPHVKIEIRSLRMIATVKSKTIELPKLERSSSGKAAVKRQRQCFFKGRFMDTPIYDGLLVGAGDILKGHAIVETPSTTIVIPPGFTCNVDQYGTYILKREV